MADVVLLAFAEPSPSAGGCGGCACGTDASCATLRAPVLACRDALVADGATVDVVTVDADTEIDAVLPRLDAPARPDGLTWPATDGGPRLVVAAAVDGQLRAVLRRMVRRYAPPPSKRPPDLPASRTMPDLPVIGILPLDPGRSSHDLPGRLDLPRDPAEVAKAVLHGEVQRLDLLRNDGGSVTAHGALLAGSAPWSARIEVDDVVLAEPDEAVLACAIANADGYATVDGLPLAPGADPADGQVTVAVAVPVVDRSLLGRRRVRIEVRRVRGRAVSVAPVTEVRYTDDGVTGELGRKRSWWIEPGAWGVFRP